MKDTIKVIDLFSGPGGLGEGFSSLKYEDGSKKFKLITSIEKEKSAHRTLKLRAFFRQFDQAPKEYYDFLKGKLGDSPEELLYKMPKFEKQVKAAESEALNLELGKDNEQIFDTISTALGKDECVLIGGPPCQAYSVAGVARNKSNSNYDAISDSRNFLYKEYLRVIALFQPLVFVMENVKGMLSAKVNGEYIHESIFKDLENPCSSIKLSPLVHNSHSYKVVSLAVSNDDNSVLRPKNYIIHSEHYGIPQRRHRVILVGVRDDISDQWNNTILEQVSNQVSVGDILKDLPKLRSGLSKELNTDKNWIESIVQYGQQSVDSLINNQQQLVAEEFIKTLSRIKVPKSKQGSVFGLKREGSIDNKELQDWFYDDKLGKHVCNHQTRGHLSLDLQRYIFCSAWAKVGYKNNWERLSPKANEFPSVLIPNHKNFNTGKFADRFRVQPENKPATTITCHISKDGHYYIHPDPEQCRSLTVREAARIQTFPDNYFFVGNRTQQYVQVGNAVPPLLSAKIAKLIGCFLYNLN